jgi:hypothetical protein
LVFVLMRLGPILASFAVSACVQSPPQTAAFSPAVQSAQKDVERAVLERFGAAALARARASSDFIAVLRYPGLPMPPYDTDGHPIKPSYPTALLFREHGQWLAYGASGPHRVLPRWSEPLEALLRDPRLFAEPSDGGPVGCTDAGASYVWLRIKGRPEQARVGHCGGSPLTDQLVSAAFMG